MRLIKYSLKEPHSNTNITRLIDWEKSSFMMQGYMLLGSITTKGPHGIIDGENIIVTLNTTSYTTVCIKTGIDTFQFTITLRGRINVKAVEVAPNDTTTITLEEPVNYHIGQHFNIYDINNNVLYTDCSFVERDNDTLIYALINIPELISQGSINQNDINGMYISDDRAFSWENEEVFSGTTVITVAQQYINVKVGLEQQQEINLSQDDTYTKLINDEIKSAVVGLPADMEKQIFEPVYDNNRVTKIVFNLHCRKRDADNGWKTITTGNSKNDWWNSIDRPDSITDLGFTLDEDVAFQRKRLKKTFLRLSFYDSPDKFSQNLLAYTTIFYDTNTAYSTWSKNKIKDENDKTKALSFEPINASFSVTDRYDYLSSSEGFYLYLYPDQLDKISGDTIYMKAELNNAKYGKIVNLFVPKDLSGNAITLASEDFRTSYLVSAETANNEVEWYTDVNQLALDMYSKVKLHYDVTTGKYTYSFPWATNFNNGKLVIDLIEPKGN